VKKRTRIFLATICIVAIIAIFLFIQITKAGSNNLKVWILDVGQGDGILIKTPNNIDVLIDGGPGRSILEKLGEALPFWDRHIDLIILTHPHADHVNGLVEVLKRYRVDQVLEPNFNNNSPGYIAFDKLIKEKNIKKTIAKDGQEIILGENLIMDIFWPPQPLNEWTQDLNDISVVSKLSYGEIDFLLTGDLTSNAEKEILDEGLESEFLKVGHHGSKYSSSKEFLEEVSPLISIISSGEGNSFGHPHQETIDRLEEVRSEVLRTDLSGNIKIEVEENGDWKIECERNCK